MTHKHVRRSVIGALLGIAACRGDASGDPAQIASVRITAASTTAVVGQTIELTAVPLDKNGNAVAGQGFTWISSDPAIASLSSLDSSVATVRIRGVAPGTVTVVVTAARRSAQVVVTVVLPGAATLVVSPLAANLAPGSSVQLSAGLFDGAGNRLPDRPLSWRSQDEQVASVTSAGGVVARATGIALITVTADGLTGTAEIVVGPQGLLVDARTPAFYNASLSTLLDGTSLFPPGDHSAGDPRLEPAPEPSLTPVANILGNWLVRARPPLGAHWKVVDRIPSTWASNTETAIVYEVDVGTQPVLLRGDFGVDNGVFVWVNGQFKFGSMAPGVIAEGEFEYRNIDLGRVPAGVNYIQVLREDRGSLTGYSARITASAIQ
ncbi:MAG: Ig-like domain-containing protein [Gemmatimonadaceae bacterium]